MWAGAAKDPPLDEVGIIFLKRMFDDTKTIAEPNADSNPRKFDAEKSEEQAIMTPDVRGKRDRYVFGEYLTLNSNA